MRILVAGTAGFIGSHLTEFLAKNDIEVFAVDCFLTNSYSSKLKQKNWNLLNNFSNVKLIELDLRTPLPRKIFDNLEVVINLAAMPGLMKSWSEFELYASSNINLVHNLVSESIKHDVQHFIQILTSSVYGKTATGADDSKARPISPYGMTKPAAEELIKTYNSTYDLSFTMLRYFSVYGPRQRPDIAYRNFIDFFLKNKIIQIFGDGNQSRTNTYVSDCVQTTFQAIVRKPLNETINISGNESVTILEASQTMEKSLNKTTKINFNPARPGDQLHTNGVLDKAKKLLNFEDQVTFEEGIEKQTHWQRENSKN